VLRALAATGAEQPAVSAAEKLGVAAAQRPLPSEPPCRPWPPAQARCPAVGNAPWWAQPSTRAHGPGRVPAAFRTCPLPAMSPPQTRWRSCTASCSPRMGGTVLVTAAARERIVYERLRARRNLPVQPLLVPLPSRPRLQAAAV
jgi:hypothetical protein